MAKTGGAEVGREYLSNLLWALESLAWGPLVRLILNQIGRRLTEELNAKSRPHRVLLMLDEFLALGRLDFFESALAFMAGYGLKSFLIAQV